MDRLTQELFELLSIPSISSGGGDAKDMQKAAEWLKARIESSKGTAEIVKGDYYPMVAGQISASRSGAPTVLIYGHYDVQSADPIEAWDSPPFEPTVRNDRIYARGASDDKGNFYPLLFVACEMAEKGELPVNVRILVEGEEESLGDSAVNWVKADEQGADCAIVFDSDMVDESTPALTIGSRGIVAVDVAVRVAERDLHSGLYGGSVPNAMHVLTSILTSVLPGPEGRLADELRFGRVEPTEAEVITWGKLPAGEQVIKEIDARLLHPTSGDNYYRQNWTEPSIDVNGIAGGDAVQHRTIVPAAANAKLTMRLAPGQTTEQVIPVLTGRLRDAAPEGVDVEVKVTTSAEPSLFDPDSVPLKLAAKAIELASGTAPALVRSGGTIPVLAALAARGIQTVVSGFALAEDYIHAPNESFRVESLRLGAETSRQLYLAFAELGRG